MPVTCSIPPSSFTSLTYKMTANPATHMITDMTTPVRMLLIRSELIILNIMDRFTGKGELSMVIPPFLPENCTFPLSWIASTGLILNIPLDKNRVTAPMTSRTARRFLPAALPRNAVFHTKPISVAIFFMTAGMIHCESPMPAMPPASPRNKNCST